MQIARLMLPSFILLVLAVVFVLTNESYYSLTSNYIQIAVCLFALPNLAMLTLFKAYSLIVTKRINWFVIFIYSLGLIALPILFIALLTEIKLAYTNEASESIGANGFGMMMFWLFATPALGCWGYFSMWSIRKNQIL